jgi:prepilin peptidase CpaA
MPNVQIALYVILVPALVISVITDLRRRLILDVVTYPLALFGLALRGGLVGWRGDGASASFGLLQGLIGFAVGFVVFLLMPRDAMGWGDVKLMGAVGAVVGFPVVLYAVMFTSLVGGLIAILVLLWDGSLVKTMASTLRFIAHMLHIKRLKDDELPKKYIPYGVAIALGSVWAVYWDLTHPIWTSVDASG